MEIQNSKIPPSFQRPVTKQDTRQTTSRSDPSKLLALDCADILISTEFIEPFMEKVCRFCRNNESIPKDIKESAIEYMRTESAFIQKWGIIDNGDNIFWYARLYWRFFKLEKYKDYKENYAREELELHTAREKLLTKFTRWGKSYLKLKVGDSFKKTSFPLPWGWDEMNRNWAETTVIEKHTWNLQHDYGYRQEEIDSLVNFIGCFKYAYSSDDISTIVEISLILNTIEKHRGYLLRRLIEKKMIEEKTRRKISSSCELVIPKDTTIKWVDTATTKGILLFMERLIHFCRTNKFVPKELRESAVEYECIEATFNKKWGGILHKHAAFTRWRFLKPEKYKDYKENYAREEAEFFAARKDFLTKFTDWGKNWIRNLKAGDLPGEFKTYKELYILLDEIEVKQRYLLPERKISS